LFADQVTREWAFEQVRGVTHIVDLGPGSGRLPDMPDAFYHEQPGLVTHLALLQQTDLLNVWIARVGQHDLVITRLSGHRV
jgi:hypothetical protein